MKFILRNHKKKAGKFANQYHGAYSKIFKILSQGSLGFVEEYWEESFEPMPGSQDWMLEVGGDNIEADKLEKILAIKAVEEYA